jgi:hypothetical protein
MDSLPAIGPETQIVWAVDSLRMRDRLTRSCADVATLRDEVAGWVVDRRGKKAFRRFVGHLEVLETVLLRLLDRVAAVHAEPIDDIGAGYERCRRLDRCTAVVRAVFQWYSAKYDQRLDGRPDAELLRAADEITRSCWQEAFVRSYKTAPTGPLCFVDNRSDGHVLRRCSVPGELKLSGDPLVAELVAELPVPVIALPETTTREAWWLTVTAHETGHHIEHDLGLADHVHQAVAAAVPAELGKQWKSWRGEVFADAFSVVMLGTAASWVVEELQFGTDEHLLRPGGVYPAPVVRLALLGELVRDLGGPADVFSAAEAEAWLRDLTGPQRDEALAHVQVVSRVARTLLEVPVAQGTLRELAEPAVITGNGRVRSWAEQLGREKPLISPTDTRAAPRFILAAGVHSYRDSGEHGMLHRNLVCQLANSGAPGVLAAGPDQQDITTLADRLADRLLAGGGPE